jgi:hypothetical protein
MINSIFNIIICTPNAKATMLELSDFFDTPPHYISSEEDTFSAELIKVANLDILVLEVFSFKDFDPFFYGLTFTGTKEKFKRLDDLNKFKIPHTFPIKTDLGVTASNNKCKWSVTLLKGLLDNEMLAPYRLGSSAGNNLFTRFISTATYLLMQPNWVKKASTFGRGNSIVLFVDAGNGCKDINTYSAERPPPKTEVEIPLEPYRSEVTISLREDNELWELIGQPIKKKSPFFRFMKGLTNKIDSVAFYSDTITEPKTFYLGNACFVIRPQTNTTTKESHDDKKNNKNRNTQTKR